jgi:hypothetical protein
MWTRVPTKTQPLLRRLMKNMDGEVERLNKDETGVVVGVDVVVEAWYTSW